MDSANDNDRSHGEVRIPSPNKTVDNSSLHLNDGQKSKDKDVPLSRFLEVNLHDLRLDDTQSSPFDFKLPRGLQNESEAQRLACHVCNKDLTHMNIQRQQQHLNRCMDKAEKPKRAAPASVVLDCPICGKRLKSEKQRNIHLKICGKSSGLKPKELLEKIKNQEKEVQQNGSNIPSLQKPQTERPTQKTGRRKTTATKTKQSWETDEELQVAMAISASLTDQESKNAVSDLYERKTKKKKKGGKSSKTENLIEMPVLLSRSEEERTRITIDRFSNILEWNSDEEEEEQIKLPPSRLKRKKITNQSTPPKPHVNYWSLASLTGNYDENQEFMSKQSQKCTTDNERSLSILSQSTRTMRAKFEQNVSGSFPSTCKILAELAEDHMTQSTGSSPRQQVSTEEPWHKNNLIECFSSLVDNEFLSDVKIHCENDSAINAHSFIIQLRCPDLHKNLSRDDMRWSCDLRTYSKASVLAFLRYMYAANIDISVFILPEVIRLLKRYHMQGLDDLCQKLQADREENNQDTQFISKNLDELMEGIDDEEIELIEKMSCSDNEDEHLYHIIDSDDAKDDVIESPPRANLTCSSSDDNPSIETPVADKIQVKLETSYALDLCEISKNVTVDENGESKECPQAYRVACCGETNDNEKETIQCIASTPVVRNVQRRHFHAPTTSPILEPSSHSESVDFTSSLRRRIANRMDVHENKTKIVDSTSLLITNHDSKVNLDPSQTGIDVSIKDNDNRDEELCADNEDEEFKFAYDEDVGIWNESGDVCDLTGKQPEEVKERAVRMNEDLCEEKESDYSQIKDKWEDNNLKEKKRETTISSPITKNTDLMNASVSVSPGEQLHKDALEFSCTQSFLLDLQSGRLHEDQLWGGCVVKGADCQNQLSTPTDVLPDKVKKKKKAPSKGKEAQVSMPCVDALNTPALKKELSQFGVKALSKKQSKILLTEIYRQSEIGKGKVAEDKEANKPSSHDVSESDQSSTEQSESETTDDDDNLLLDENLICSPTKHGQDIDMLLCEFIKQHTALHTSILLYEAIDFPKLHQDVIGSGIKCSKANLIQFLDKKCINFRFTEAGSQHKKPRGKRKQKRKAKSST